MRSILVLAVTFAVLAFQFYMGTRRKILFGAVLPVIFLALGVFLLIQAINGAGLFWVADNAYLSGLTGAAATAPLFITAAALLIVWVIGFMRSKSLADKHNRMEIEKMRAKDME